MASRAQRSQFANDAKWRQAVIDKYGECCIVCGTNHWVQAAHLMPKGQGGLSDTDNGAPMCQQHHVAYDSSRLTIKPEWLHPDQVAWLADHHWVRWSDDGSVSGRGMKHFSARIIP